MPRHEYVASPGGTMRNKSTGQRKGVTKVGKRFKATAWDAEQGKRRYIGMYDNSSDAAAGLLLRWPRLSESARSACRAQGRTTLSR